MTNDEAQDTVQRLNASAPRIGAALSGIEAVAELLAAAQLDDETAPGSNTATAKALNATRRHALLGTVAVLADYTHTELLKALGEHGEDRMVWGTGYQLNGEHLHHEPGWWLRERSAKS